MSFYLTVDEQATYIEVLCDGFLLRVDDTDNNNSVFAEIWDPTGSSLLVYIQSTTYVSSIEYAAGRTGRTFSLIENTSTRVGIQVNTNYKNSSDTDLTNSASLIFYIWIYSDRIVFDQEWIIETSTIDLDDSINNCGLLVQSNANEHRTIYENSNDEDFATNYTAYNSADYLGFSSNSLNIIGTVLQKSNSADFTQRSRNTGQACWGWNNTDPAIAIGTRTMSIMLVIDSADREEIQPVTTWTDTNFNAGDLVLNDDLMGYECILDHDSGDSSNTRPDIGDEYETYWVQCHGYTISQRLEQGVQYMNLSELTIPTGTAKTDGTGSINIGTDGFDTTGAYNIITDNGDIEVEFGQIEHKPSIVLHDFPTTTGNGSIDHTIFRWNCSGAGSSTYDKLEGTLSVTNATYQDGGLLCDATGEEGRLSSVTSTTIPYKGCILLEFQRTNTTYASSYSRLFDLGTTGTVENFTIYRNNSADLYFVINDTSGVFNDAIDIIYDYNQHLLGIYWDSEFNKRQLYIDGIFYEESTTFFTMPTITGNDLVIGNRADGNRPSDGIINDIKIIDDWILPYGAYFIGNTTGQLISGMYHKDILTYIEGTESNSDSLQIGTGVITLSGITTSTDIAGNSNSALYINGDTDVISIPAANNIDGDGGSIAFWYRGEGASSSYPTFVCESAGYTEFSLYYGTGTDIWNAKINEATISFSNAVDNPFTYEWHWIVFKWSVDQNWQEIWINGTLRDRTTVTITSPTLTTLYFGKDASGSDNIYGTLSDIYITNNPNTQVIPTIAGVPIDAPIRRED